MPQLGVQDYVIKFFLFVFLLACLQSDTTTSPLIDSALATYCYLRSIKNYEVQQKSMRYIPSSSRKLFHVFLIELLNEKTFEMSFVSSKCSDC